MKKRCFVILIFVCLLIGIMLFKYKISGNNLVGVYVDNIEVDYFESDNGFISIFINEKGEYDVSVCYPGTFGMRVSKYVSIIGSIVFIGYIIVKKKL